MPRPPSVKTEKGQYGQMSVPELWRLKWNFCVEKLYCIRGYLLLDLHDNNLPRNSWVPDGGMEYESQSRWSKRWRFSKWMTSGRFEESVSWSVTTTRSRSSYWRFESRSNPSDFCALVTIVMLETKLEWIYNLLHKRIYTIDSQCHQKHNILPHTYV